MTEQDKDWGQAPETSEDAADSATPGKKAIDDTRESSEERRAHPGTAETEEGSS